MTTMTRLLELIASDLNTTYRLHIVILSEPKDFTVGALITQSTLGDRPQVVRSSPTAFLSG
jgi:hypothetical protein